MMAGLIKCFKRQYTFNLNQGIDYEKHSKDGKGFEQDFFRADEFLRHIPDVVFISKAEMLCPREECPLFIGDDFRPLFLDDQHLSSAGIAYFSGLLRDSNTVQDFLR